MILAIAFCERDQDLMLKNIKWWNELGGCKGHKAMLWRDRRTDLAKAEEIKAEAHKCFDDILVFTAGAEIDGWPEGANYFMRIASNFLANRNDCKYFLWMEPDAIPLATGWMDNLEAEYKSAGKPFMGDRVEVENIPVHMSGIGIYHSPLHEKAGEAYRAHETAWDMAAKDQIIPNAHFTELIEHAWKHPKFTSIDELRTQIDPKTILFHSSKDGSLIDLLRKKRGGSFAIHREKEPTPVGSPSPLRRSTQGTVSPLPPFQNAGLTCDIFIKTYPGDYKWLKHSLRSINKYCSGFRKIWIVSPEDIPMMDTMGYEWKVMNEEAEDGYLAQQIHKLYADVITDYQADYILHVDSDVILTQPVTPASFIGKSRNVVWPYTPYGSIETPWQPITEKFMNQPVENEFMRRFPIMVPRWLYGKLREFCQHTHKCVISDYIRRQPLRAFSEFNALGAFAWTFHHEAFEWVNTLDVALPEPYARQFHSWGGITDEVKAEIDTILSGREEPVSGESGDSAEPRASLERPATQTSLNAVSVLAEPKATECGLTPITVGQVGEAREGNGTPVEPQGSATDSRGGVQTPDGIKELPNGIWVIEGDTHVSKWVEQQGRLDHDMNTLPFILPYIDKGYTVIDAGAFIGDHTIAYARAVGPSGKVYAFEPNPVAFGCLTHNLAAYENVHLINTGLSDKPEDLPLSGNNGNAAGVYIGDHMKVADVRLERLDDMHIVPNLIKFDIEGCEVRALVGATATIEAYHPILIIEVNEVALKRQQCEPKNIFFILETMGYKWKIMQENCHTMSPMFDIIAWHEEEKKLAPVSPYNTMKKNVKALAEYANESHGNKIQVVMALRKHKIIKKQGKK